MRTVFIRKAALLLLGVLILSFAAPAQRKKKKGDEDPVTQTLPILKDPPAASEGETQRLVFHVSPLSSKGLLSQQVRDGLKELLKSNHGAVIVKLRAFVAGSGDLRRVQAIVSEVFTEHKMNLPALSTIQAGGLPMEGAQVVLESVAEEKRVMNPNGLAFFAGQQAKDVKTAISQLEKAAVGGGVRAAEVLRSTCFLSSLDDVPTGRRLLGAAFPAAVVNFVQTQRLALEPVAECEAVGRLDQAPKAPVVFLNPPGLTQNPNYSQIALVNAPKLVFSGSQLAFGEQDRDIRLAFDHLGKDIEPLGAGFHDVFWTSVYPTTLPVANAVRAARFDYFDKSRPPASTFLQFEGLPSLDATVGMEVIAASTSLPQAPGK